MITIESVDNGYIIKQVTGEKEFDTTEVVENDESEFGDINAGVGVLWKIVEYLGLYGSKHDARRIRIKVVNQDGKEVDE